jgi:hypothetical protein
MMKFGPRSTQRLEAPLHRCVRMSSPFDRSVEPAHEIAGANNQPVRAAFGVLDRVPDPRFQLAPEGLDPETTWLEYVESLPLPGANVNATVEMLVVDSDHGRVAFDIVDDRLERDIDDEGLVLLALQHRGIRLTEVDSESMDEDPHVGNSLLIWRHHGHRVDQQLVGAIDRVLAGRQQIKVRTLGTLVELSQPQALVIVSALISQGMMDTDLSVRFGPDSFVTGPWGPAAGVTSQVRSAVRLFARKKP